MSELLRSQSAAAPLPTSRPGDAADASPASRTPSAHSTPGAGEVPLTHGQKVALLYRSYSDWSRAITKELRKRGRAAQSADDFVSLAPLGLAVIKPSGHSRLTPAGSREARLVAMEFGRELGLHTIDYNIGGTFGRVASAYCLCGWSAHRSRAINSFSILIGKDAEFHLRHVGAKR